MSIAEERLISLFRSAPLRHDGGRFYFIAGDGADTSQEVAGGVRSFFKRWPTVYRVVTFWVSRLFDEGISSCEAIAHALPGSARARGMILDVGSGLEDLGDGVVHLDAAAFGPVQVVADAADLPFRDASFDMVISESLLEHCPEPERVIAEIQRVVRPGGYVYCSVPFLYPFHASPGDYTRFTLAGLRRRFGGCDVIAAGTQSGPITALSIQCAYILALLTSFGSGRLYDILLQFWIVAFSPLRVLNLVLRPFTQRDDAAAALYLFAKKRL